MHERVRRVDKIRQLESLSHIAAAIALHLAGTAIQSCERVNSVLVRAFFAPEQRVGALPNRR